MLESKNRGIIFKLMEKKIKLNLIKVYLYWQGDRIKRKFNGNLQESLSLRSLRIENTKNGSKRKVKEKKSKRKFISLQLVSSVI